jgi:hypothetical protein
MRRVETYVGQQVYEWLFSVDAQNTMTSIAKVCAALFGTGGTVNGLACTATGPASMAVQIGAGEIYQMEALEATTCGTLPANTTNTILKQGIQLGTYTTSTFAVPGTSGQSINYLIEAQYQDSDISLDPTSGASPVVLQFYNAANPTTPWSGPSNSGSTSNTFRDGIIAYQIKAGTAATTGTQVTPSPDTGWIGLWVITVAYGATSLTSANIAQYTGSPVLPTGILQSILTSNLTYGVDSGSANTVQAKFPIPVATLTDGLDVWVKIAAANTGATTFTPNPGVISASPVIGAAHAALQGGELVVGGRANLIWRQDVSSWVLVECTGAAIQVAPATASNHAMQLGQATGRLLNIQTFNSSGTYTPTAGTTHCRVTVVGPGSLRWRRRRRRRCYRILSSRLSYGAGCYCRGWGCHFFDNWKLGRNVVCRRRYFCNWWIRGIGRVHSCAPNDSIGRCGRHRVWWEYLQWRWLTRTARAGHCRIKCLRRKRRWFDFLARRDRTIFRNIDG